MAPLDVVCDVVHQDYTSWNAQYCKSSLNGLRRTAKRVSITLDPAVEPQDVPAIGFFTVEDFITNASHKVSLPAVTLTISQSLQPCAPYESCTPLSRNLMVGDDSENLPALHFSDDPNYPTELENQEYHYFSWQLRYQDPDDELMMIETVDQLRSALLMTEEDVDRLAILPKTCERLRKLKSRSSLHHSFDNSRENLNLTLALPPPPREAVKYFLSYFCNNTNCMTSFCTTHLFDIPSPNPTFMRIQPADIIFCVMAPCGPGCFSAPFSRNIGTYWTQRDTELHSMILDYTPDSLPCDIAAILSKPCQEVYRKRYEYRSPATHPRPSIASKTKYEEHPSVFTPYVAHGANDTASDQSIAISRVVTAGLATLELAARVSETKVTVELAVVVQSRAPDVGKDVHAGFWIGCAERQSVRALKRAWSAILRCASVAMQKGEQFCRSVGLQNSDHKETVVKSSTWGLGLFVLENCSKGDLIAEYLGEMIFEPTVRSRSIYTEFRHRSYVFELNPTYAVDADSTGNVTRYINHHPDANCITSVYLVNGDQRVGVYAARRLAAGEELFINYGPKFYFKPLPRGG